MPPYTLCPKCHFHEPSAAACSRCGTVFEKWYAAHKPEPPREPESVIAEAVARMERERTIDRARWRQAKWIAILIIVVALAIALIKLVASYRHLFSNA
jgi:hypothetical protein